MNKAFRRTDAGAYAAGHTLGNIDIENRHPHSFLLAFRRLAADSQIVGCGLDSLNGNTLDRACSFTLHAADAILDIVIQTVSADRWSRDYLSRVLQRDQSVNLPEIIGIVNAGIALAFDRIEKMAEGDSHAGCNGGYPYLYIAEILTHIVASLLAFIVDDSPAGYRM
jgi:hypothetical protein